MPDDPGIEVHFELVAVTKQVTDWNLPTTQTKRAGSRHAKNFEGDSAEAARHLARD